MASIDTSVTTKPLLAFPNDFLIKVIGYATESFEIAVLQLVQQHCPKLREDAIRQHLSKQGKYLSLSIFVPVESQAQLDALYCALSACPEVVMAL